MTRPRILVVSWGLMGDTIMATPALRALRLGQPDAHIAFSCQAAWAGLFDHPSVADQIIPVRLRTWKGLGGMLWRRPRDLTAIARPGWDAVLDLGGGGNVIRLVGRIRPARAISMRAEAHPRFHGVVDAAVRHQVDRCLAVAAQLGGQGGGRAYLLAPLAPEDAAWSAPRGKRVALNPGASLPSKRWPAQRFAEVARQLLSQGYDVLVLWGPGEQDLAATIATASGARLAPPTSPRRLAELLAACDVCISNDSGPMHLAAGAGAAVVALFSTADPAIYTPPGRVEVIRHGGPIDDGGPDPATVSAATLRLLAGPAT